jgi:hypothetical protein
MRPEFRVICTRLLNTPPKLPHQNRRESDDISDGLRNLCRLPLIGE